MNNKPKEKWYFKVSTLIIAFLCVGPLALPLIWINPRFSHKTKIIITIVVIILGYVLWLLVAYSLKSISNYYNFIFQQM